MAAEESERKAEAEGEANEAKPRRAKKKGRLGSLLEKLNLVTKSEYLDEVALAMEEVRQEEAKREKERGERLKREAERQKREAEEAKKPKSMRRVRVLKREIPGLRRRPSEEEPKGPPKLNRQDVRRSQVNYYFSYLVLFAAIFLFARGLLYWGARPVYAMVMWGSAVLVFAYFRHLNTKAWQALWKYKDSKKWVFPYQISMTMLLVLLGLILVGGGLNLIGQKVKDIFSLLSILIFLLVLVTYKTASTQRRQPTKATERILQASLLLLIPALLMWYFLAFVLPAMLLMLLAIAMVATTYGADPLHRSSMPVGLRLLYSFLIVALALPFLCFSFYTTILRPRAGVLGYGSVISRLQHRPAALAWSEDGRSIAYSFEQGGRWKFAVYSVDNGEELIEIEAGEQETRPIFLVDPGKIGFDGVQGGRRNIYVGDLLQQDGGVQLTDGNIAPFGDSLPYCAEDRNFYYVLKGRGGDALAYVRDDAKERGVLYQTANEITAAAPSPRGDALLWVERIGNEEKVYLMDLETKLKKVIADNSEIKVIEKWTPQGRRVVEVLRRFMVKYDLMESADLPIRLGAPVWCADNRTFAYITTKGKRRAVRVLHRDGLYERRVYKAAGARLSRLSISPDGKKVIFQSDVEHLLFRDTVNEVKVVRIEDRQVKSLVPKNIDYFAPVYAANGAKIAFASGNSLWYPSRGYGLWVAILR